MTTLTPITIRKRTKRRATPPQMGTAIMIISLLLAAMELLNVGMTDEREAKEQFNKPGEISVNKIAMIDYNSNTTMTGNAILL